MCIDKARRNPLVSAIDNFRSSRGDNVLRDPGDDIALDKDISDKRARNVLLGECRDGATLEQIRRSAHRVLFDVGNANSWSGVFIYPCEGIPHLLIAGWSWESVARRHAREGSVKMHS